MIKYENVNAKQLSELLCRSEAKAGITVTLPQLYSAMQEKKAVNQVVAGEHIFIIVFSDDKYTLDFYYSSPATGTRKASLNTSDILKVLKSSNMEAIIGFSWTPQEMSFSINSKNSPLSFGTKGGESDKKFRVDKFGNIAEISISTSNLYFYIDGKMNLSPTAIETWDDTIKTVKLIVEKGYLEDEFQYNASITNSIISMVVSGFEIYHQKRFLEIQGEGIEPNIISLVNDAIAKKSKQTYKEELYAYTLEELVSKKKINFQNYDICTLAYDKCYGIIFGSFEDSLALNSLQKYIKCRHQIIHVYPSFTCLNMKELPKEEPIMSNKETANNVIQTFDQFIKKLHVKTTELRKIPT
ncbi:hypothetical protein [Sulfurimonas sp.]|uniref:hypothetical protein n=1 Tax=Sulfurimonas sp. TaxID=2022749 RepID=UPI002638BCF3|nr:hypothetical protein [Sulfurimonas sp.]MDD3855960.1 hypothetical protein [Sulfurimonas sp.]